MPVDYTQDIGKTFDGFKLLSYQTTVTQYTRQHTQTFKMACPMGHIHTYDAGSNNPETCQKICWCQKEQPLKRERLRNGLSVSQASKRLNVKQGFIRFIENHHYTSGEDLNFFFQLYDTPKDLRDQLTQELIDTGRYSPSARNAPILIKKYQKYKLD